MKKDFLKIDIYKTGQNIKQIMNRKRMTVKDIQEYLELAAPQSIYHWFDGRSLPTVDHLYALSGLFHMPMDMLVCGNRKEDYYFWDHPVCKRLIVYFGESLEILAS